MQRRRLAFDLSFPQVALPELLRSCTITRRTELQGNIGFRVLVILQGGSMVPVVAMNLKQPPKKFPILVVLTALLCAGTAYGRRIIVPGTTGLSRGFYGNLLDPSRNGTLQVTPNGFQIQLGQLGAVVVWLK